MRKPDKIRAIYAELRTVLGPEVPSRDLLKIAYIIFRSYASNLDELTAFGRPREGRSIMALAVDEAIADGGWRILEFERLGLLNIVDPQETSDAIRWMVGQFLGLGWQHARSDQ